MEPDAQLPHIKATSFETAIGRLTEIVDKLEHGDLPLEEAIALFEEGISLARVSQTQLEKAEQRVEELLSVDPSGTAVTQPFKTE